MCVLVYVSSIDKKVKTQLLDLISLDATNCSVKNIFESFKNILQDKNIPITNVIGMASDNVSVMIGHLYNFFASYLKSEVTRNSIIKIYLSFFRYYS